MKILQITNSLMSGGAEKLVVDTSIRFLEKGLEVDVLLLDGSKTPFLETLEKYPDIKLISLGKTRNIYNPLNIFSIIKYIKNYDIIHVHLFPALYWVSLTNMISSKKHNLILTEHNTTNRRRKLFLFKFLDRIIYKQYKKVITISNAVDDNLRKHIGGSAQNFKKIYNGIHLDTFTNAHAYEKKKLGYKESDCLLLQVASFTAQKDQKTLLQALYLLPNNFKLILVGDGPLKKMHMNLCQEFNIQDRVQFMGLRSDVPKLLKTVDYVILSSHYEGLSLSSVEGMASGKPFIASNVPGLSEVVDGAGVLFPAGDFKKLYKEILKLVTDLEHHHNVINACIKRSKCFDIQIMVDKYVQLYETIITCSKKN